MDAHRTCSIWLGVGDGKMQTFRLVAYSESTADVRACMPQAVCAGTGVPSCVCVMSHASCTLLQFYNDQNVTKINASRFEREGCSESCYQNYALTGIDLAHTRAHTRTHAPILFSVFSTTPDPHKGGRKRVYIYYGC